MSEDNGVKDEKVPYPERRSEHLVCRNDWSWVGFFKHDKFYLNRDPETGFIFLSCAKCGVTYTAPSVMETTQK